MSNKFQHAFKIDLPFITKVLVTEIGVSEIKGATKINQFRRYNGLWDTGATNTVITPKIAKALNLKPIDKVFVNAVNGRHEVNRYLIRTLRLPNRVAFEDLIVTEGTLNGEFDLLIGMDLITRGDFTLCHHGNKTLFCFSIPPHSKKFDLLERAKKVNERVEKRLRKAGRI